MTWLTPTKIILSEMKFCQPHWESLKAAINARGLGDFIASSGEEALKKMTAADRGDVANFDPLISAHNVIVSNSLQVGGSYLMGMDPEGNHYCPVCEADKHGQTGWIDKAADGAQQVAANLKQQEPPP